MTEDADLGLRLARMGADISMIRAPTVETPPRQLKVWLRQRSRWIKGYMQTWLVLMRDPVTLWREMGAVKFIGLQLNLGGAILAPLLHLPFVLAVLSGATVPGLDVGAAGLALLVMGALTGVMCDGLAPVRWSLLRVIAMATRVFYWPLQSFAAAHALVELGIRPHFWAKTPHEPVAEFRTRPCTIGTSRLPSFSLQAA